ncbi:FmdE family protein [Sinanaerobacter chloroacetimidivorans]|jgi:formylmethanofuran dehydrogenase subunit E|uniref:TraR/DksA C4-type zinc finger protein n=1 Tax=Sinanaerobacter chloroacetimidivorans TaxID=2818044 RepID=A0A8J7W3R1_9FIRM|nr:FmdE family protein [Sinanaerobacter chloroacetimidivorans]MBR0600332.1 TraR/DksA C4-type zinc finger protein [Sinanaerobacter chloroacetimidivorans]
MDIHALFDQSAAFHGHTCPGLAIGVRAAAEAQRILGLKFSEDEEIVCVTENDACGVDGIQVILGCSAGKGNLIFRMRGKQAYSFFNRKNGRKVRLVLKNLPKMDREEKQKFILDAPFEDVFLEKQPDYGLPEEARIFESIECEICGEKTAEPYIRLENGKKVCIDCVTEYHRV